MEFIIGDLLCLLPFLRPIDGDTIQVPVKIESEWHLVDYTIERIEITPSWMGSPLVAYGLKNPDFPPLLLYKGTTYPSDEGACLSFLTDLNPFASVGSYAFSIGREKIKTWLENNASKLKARVYGKSLGGAQAWRTALEFPEYVAKVKAYGAPGFTPGERDKIHEVTDKYKDLEIEFYCQENDPVPYSDWVADRGVNYYEVRALKKHECGILAHADMLSTHEHSEIRKMKPEEINNPLKRAAVTTARLFASVAFPFILLGHTIKTTISHTIDGCFALEG
jgi:hypothetical protein